MGVGGRGGMEYIGGCILQNRKGQRGGWERTTLGSNNTTLFQGSVEKLKIRFLKQRLSRAFWVAAVGDDDIEFILAVREEFEAVSDVNVDCGVLISDGHSREVFLADPDDGLVDVAQDGLLDGFMLDDLSEDTAVTAANDQDGLGVGVGVHGQVCDHLLIGKFVPFGALDDVVEDKDGAMVAALEDQDVLVLRLFVVEDLVDLEDHGLAGPHIRDFSEPAICAGRLA